MRLLFFLLLATSSAFGQAVPSIKDFLSCPNSPNGQQPYRVITQTAGDMRRVYLDGPNAICNDGTRAEMFVRAAKPGATEPDGPAANKWVIHLLGGSSCSSYEECGTRWCGIGAWEGTLMTTRFDAEFRNVDGLFGRNNVNRLGDRNQVLMKYCSSDNWQGRKSDVVMTSETDPAKAYSLHFQGANILDAALTSLERGVAGLPKLTDATDVLLSGDSAGAVGARAHLDRLAARLKTANANVRVRGNFEATFDPDSNGKQGFPAGDPRDPVYEQKMAQYNRVQVQQRNGQLDDSCLAAHPGAPYLCAENTYLEMNHLTTPFFQMHDVQDPLQYNGYVEGGLQATPVAFAQGIYDQLSALRNIRDTAAERALMTQAPGVVGRNCRVHVTFGSDDGFLGRKIPVGTGTSSYYELLWNWLNGVQPGTVLGPRPPSLPDPPVIDASCSAVAPTSPAPQGVLSGSSASYDFSAPVAPESIVASFGVNLASTTLVAPLPWPTTLGGIQVRVTDSAGVARNAPIYYVSPGQVMYLLPAGTALGAAQVSIGSQTSSVVVAVTAPGIYTAAQNGQGVAAANWVRITPAGVRTEGLTFDPATRQAVGVPGAAGDQIYLQVYGTGLRGGAATATVAGIQVPVVGPAAQAQYQGLDQLNLGPLPARIGYGAKEIVIRQGDALANSTTVTFKQP
jgi:uncharacterized protein (TIGR03437 family)